MVCVTDPSTKYLSLLLRIYFAPILTLGGIECRTDSTELTCPEYDRAARGCVAASLQPRERPHRADFRRLKIPPQAHSPAIDPTHNLDALS